ncbi:hypothetical protein ACFY12_34910 [Streptomyces sp. NPDC001339]|uniref:hypothetical protein n=1 Tax=Streptomyces sp. NPDC001339 TaxID=3364563 RepID=UPI0036B32436
MQVFFDAVCPRDDGAQYGDDVCGRCSALKQYARDCGICRDDDFYTVANASHRCAVPVSEDLMNGGNSTQDGGDVVDGGTLVCPGELVGGVESST